MVLKLGGTTIKLGGAIDGKDGFSETEGYAISEVVPMDEVAGRADESDDMDERIIEEGTEIEADFTTSLPDVNVLMIVVPTQGGDEVDDVIVTVVLPDVCVLEVLESRSDIEGVMRVNGRLVRLGGAML